MRSTPDLPLAADDPYARAAQTFPHLAPDMVERMREYGTEETVPAGAHLFERGDRRVDFFLVLEGAVEIYDQAPGCDETRVFTTHGARQFTGEVDLFNEREILVSGRAAGEARVLRIRRPDFHRMLKSEPDIGEIVLRAFILRRVGLIRHQQGGVLLLGDPGDAHTLRIAQFLIRNGYPHRQLAPEDEDAAGLLEAFRLAPDDLPAVLLPEGRLLRDTGNAALADALGLTETLPEGHVHDVAVIGAGPAGLAAAVYSASEGLDTVVLEGIAPGGQAGTSSRIENYLGFPTGISGQALAGRAQMQAQKFGARLAISRFVERLHCNTTPYTLALDDGTTLAARAVVIATGARYRKLDVAEYERFEGSGIHYAATAMEGALCAGEEVIVVGGGNSAGQAAMFLSRAAGHVHLLVRGEGLAATMSDYLVQRILSSPRVTLHPFTEITALEGERTLRHVTWTDRRSGETTRHDIAHVFVMIGAEPNTEWLDGCLALDGRGFVRTGTDETGRPLASPYATNRPGIFAVGDVRAGSVKRVASGVGEGSVVVSFVHQYLQPSPG